MTFELEFDRRALKEWHKLGKTVQAQLKEKLAEVVINPRVPGSKIRELPNCYKIKLRSSGYRLIYQVQDKRVVVFVLAIGKRENEEAYETAKTRLTN